MTSPTTLGGSRWPWLLWGIAMLLLAATLSLVALNEDFAEDPYFIPLAIAMILGYSSVGVVLASRNPHNPIGWLLLSIGILFVLSGFTDEYLFYTYETNPGALPFGPLAALLTSTTWTLMIAAVVLVALLFPTGRVPSPRWRFLPPTIVGSAALFLVGSALGVDVFTDIGVDATIENPIHVEAIGRVGEALAGLASLVIVACSLPSIAALVMRYRRSEGEERQQVRWLAYVAGIVVGAILLGIATGLVMGEDFGRSWLGAAFFLGTFSLIGIGVPVALGIAVLRYRLYDLDLVIKKTVVFAILVGLLVLIGGAVGVLVGMGLVPSLYDSPPLLLLAGVAYGLLTIPLYRLSKRIADRIVYGGRASPYEVLTEFSERVGETYAAEDVLPRMAAVLGEGTGADEATVWLRLGAELRAAATWPAGAEAPAVVPEGAVDVQHRGESLGALSVAMPVSDPMNPSKERLMRDLASQAGLVLRNVRLIEDLRESRRRIVTAQDERAKKLERDIHDGAQQQLVALSVKLKLLQQLAAREPDKAGELAEVLQTDATEALEGLRDLARGIYPPLLADKGLAPAIEAQARKSPTPVTLDPDGVGRYTPEVESAVYFSVLEALQNVSKYAEATRADVRLRAEDGTLGFIVSDDGRGFDTTAARRGTGLQGMADRLAALGGELDVSSTPGDGTMIAGRVPIGGGRS